MPETVVKGTPSVVARSAMLSMTGSCCKCGNRIFYFRKNGGGRLRMALTCAQHQNPACSKGGPSSVAQETLRRHIPRFPDRNNREEKR